MKKLSKILPAVILLITLCAPSVITAAEKDTTLLENITLSIVPPEAGMSVSAQLNELGDDHLPSTQDPLPSVSIPDNDLYGPLQSEESPFAFWISAEDKIFAGTYQNGDTWHALIALELNEGVALKDGFSTDDIILEGGEIADFYLLEEGRIILIVARGVIDNRIGTVSFVLTPPYCGLQIITEYYADEEIINDQDPIPKVETDLEYNFGCWTNSDFYSAPGFDGTVSEYDYYYHTFESQETWHATLYFWSGEENYNTFKDDLTIIARDRNGNELEVAGYELYDMEEEDNFLLAVMVQGSVGSCGVNENTITRIDAKITPPSCDTEVTAEKYEYSGGISGYFYNTQTPYPDVKITDSNAHYVLDGDEDRRYGYYVTEEDDLFVGTYKAGDSFYAIFYVTPESDRYTFAKQLEFDLNEGIELIYYEVNDDNYYQTGYSYVYIVIRGKVPACEVSPEPSASNPIRLPKTGIERTSSWNTLIFLGACVFFVSALKKNR